MSKVQCYACGLQEEAQASGLPEAWGYRSINGEQQAMCDCCNDPGNWIGGISPSLRVEIESRGIEVFEAE